MAFGLVCIAVVLLNGHSVTGSGNFSTKEAELHRDLFDNYNSDVIPKFNRSHAVHVDLDMFLVAIENIDEKKQTLTARIFLEMVWFDDFLTWSPLDYDGVKSINIKNSAIWIPDITLRGTLNKPLDIGQTDGRAIINHEGKVQMWPYKTHTIACNISVATFPLDTQVCKFDFFSWTNPTTVLQLHNPSGNLNMDYFSESGEWAVAKTDVEKYKKSFGNADYDNIKFTLTLDRKWLFHAMNIMAPVVCISLLNVFCFLLPVQSGERVTLCISIFLTLAVFLTVISSSMPESSNDVSIFGVYVGLQLLGSALTIITTVLSICLFHKNNRDPVPTSLQFLARCCRSFPTKTTKEEVSILQADGDCANHMMEGNHANSCKANVVCHRHVTWKAVSVSMDRLCFVGAICWHLFLMCFLVTGMNVK